MQKRAALLDGYHCATTALRVEADVGAGTCFEQSQSYGRPGHALPNPAAMRDAKLLRLHLGGCAQLRPASAAVAALLLEHDRRLRHLALTDGKTGLLDRRYVLERLDQALARAKRHGTPVAVLCTEVDELRRWTAGMAAKYDARAQRDGFTQIVPPSGLSHGATGSSRRAALARSINSSTVSGALSSATPMVTAPKSGGPDRVVTTTLSRSVTSRADVPGSAHKN